MSVELSELIEHFEELWPLAGAEEWDSPGLVSGDVNQRISRVLLSVDVTAEIIAEAADGEFDLVFAHHPFLLRGVQTLAETSAKGKVISSAIRANVAIYSAHTNADIVDEGVSATLASAFGITAAKPLVAASDFKTGHGRIGKLANSISLGDFARKVAGVLPSTAGGVKVAGDFDQVIHTVALCGGAGDSLISSALAKGADVYVSSDLRHHPVQDAIEQALASGKQMALIDVSHWAAEWLWLEVAANQLAQRFPEVQFVVSHLRTDPWDFVVTQ